MSFLVNLKKTKSNCERQPFKDEKSRQRPKMRGEHLLHTGNYTPIIARVLYVY